jgi:hypothetical protein
MVYTDHKNLMQDALDLTSDRMYHWRLFLKEYTPTIVYIKGIHNTVADAISRLDYGPVHKDWSTMMTFAQCWYHYTSGQEESTSPSPYTQKSMNLVFANQYNEQYHKKLNCTSHSNPYKGYNRWLVRKSFQPKELGTVKQKLTTSTLQQKFYKSLYCILMHPNSVPSWMLEQGHTCSSIKMDNTVFPSASQARQSDPTTATQRWTS